MLLLVPLPPATFADFARLGMVLRACSINASPTPRRIAIPSWPTRRSGRCSRQTRRHCALACLAVSWAKAVAMKAETKLIDMLRRTEGATIDEIVTALDWHAYTVRGAMSEALKKKLGLTIDSDRDDERGRVYRLSA
jgi:hypothetical protein